MANNLAMPGAGVDPGPIAAQGPQVDTAAMQTPPDQAAPPGASGASGASGAPGAGQGMSPELLKDTIAKQSAIDHKLRGLLSKKGALSRTDVIDMAVSLVAKRTMSAQQMAKYLASMPDDPQELREWVEQNAQQVDQSLEHMLYILPNVDRLNASVASGAHGAPPGAGGPPGAPGAPDLSGGAPGPPQQ